MPAGFDDESKQDASGCLENTREQILFDIRTWIDRGNDKGIYWLKDKAGTGKSTIALTVAREYHRKKQLGASFFFSRGSGDLASTNKFATTVAAQLAEHSPKLRQLIADASQSKPRTSQLGLYEQWEKLITKPLKSLRRNYVQSPLLIVVDGLDGCDSERDMRVLIDCFASTIAAVREIPLRIFVTSRPDLPSDLAPGSIPIETQKHFALHDVEKAVLDKDLELYYRHQLMQISERHGWNDGTVSNQAIQALVQRSHGSFIYAATACRFIDESGIFAERRLSGLCTVGSFTFKAKNELDRIYATALDSSFNRLSDPEEDTILHQNFQKVVGSIVVLFDTFTLGDLVTIIGGPQTRVMFMLNHLRPVLETSEDDGKRIDVLHSSFRDFVLDAGRCLNKTFAISAEQVHYDLFERCLVIMHSSLRKDICNLKWPGTKMRDVSKARVDKSIPPPVRYACRYWMKHLKQSGRSLINHEGLSNFFRVDFLAWLEVLALQGLFPEGKTLLAGLESSLDATDDNGSQPSSSEKIKRVQTENALRPVSDQASGATQPLSTLVRDAKRFAFQYSGAIEEAPLQVYTSALQFSPENSFIRQMYPGQIPESIATSSQKRDSRASYITPAGAFDPFSF